jgi:hypothetical protein
MKLPNPQRAFTAKIPRTGDEKDAKRDGKISRRPAVLLDGTWGVRMRG